MKMGDEPDSAGEGKPFGWDDLILHLWEVQAEL